MRLGGKVPEDKEVLDDPPHKYCTYYASAHVKPYPLTMMDGMAPIESGCAKDLQKPPYVSDLDARRSRNVTYPARGVPQRQQTAEGSPESQAPKTAVESRQSHLPHNIAPFRRPCDLGHITYNGDTTYDVTSSGAAFT
ncbi:hypothetical protein ABKA04_001842 [Annulohypoxylon sp. FPYF3050]